MVLRRRASTKSRPARLGQHFLVDGRVRQRILDALRLTREHLVVEIGAGRGAMTGLLAARAGRVVAVEVDPRLAAQLREKFSADPRIEIVEGDILTLPLDFSRAPVFSHSFVFGNLPYYITSPILTRLFAHAGQFDEIVVMVQKEVAERLVAAPGSRDYGLLSVTAQFYTRPQLLFTIPPRAFHPRPQVDSALVRMTVAPRAAELEVADPEPFFRLVRAAFRQKRKTLVNNLKALYPAERLKRALEPSRIPPGARAEALSLEQFAALLQELNQ